MNFLFLGTSASRLSSIHKVKNFFFHKCWVKAVVEGQLRELAVVLS